MRVLDTSTGFLSLSVAVGSTHEMILSFVPGGIVSNMSDGQTMISGCCLSLDPS